MLIIGSDMLLEFSSVNFGTLDPVGTRVESLWSTTKQTSQKVKAIGHCFEGHGW